MASLGPSDPDSPPVFAAALQEPRLPSYSRSSPLRAEPTQIEHTYTLNSSKGAPWLIVNLKSYASSAQSLPLYHDGNLGVLEGELSINSSDLGKIKSVTAVVSSCTSSLLFGANLELAMWGANCGRAGPESELPGYAERALECFCEHIKRTLAFSIRAARRNPGERIWR